MGRLDGECGRLFFWADLQSRGLRTDRDLLLILDGSKALHTAATQMLIHRCHVHKLRTILEHLTERQRPWVRAIVVRAYQQPTSRSRTPCCATWRGDSKTAIPVLRAACVKDSMRRSRS